ncbi:hypothetical protein M0811_01222 [Anaeramoeba ignava]|uniref:BTB domain-containing protein n=1 Tax=Anaeramoeba ignava TaxID=1746090 RepID=A0A9Q0RBT6_ANAIG|nr:hypothetical protein M0811_01222 [Anaeramoeba ignava]
METYLNLEKLSNDLKNLFQNQNQNENEEESYFDFEIICEQNKISFKTHKSILSSRSEYFKTLFKSKMKEYQENKLILKDVSSSILFSILNYFYSGKIEINLENAIQILIFSSKYLIDDLIQICSKFIKKNLQIETIIDVIKLSESMKINKLLESFEHYNKLKKWINDDKFFSNLILIYSAKIDGFDCRKWHDRCDNQENLLVLIKTKDNFIFGGFTQVGFTTDKSEWENDRGYGWGNIPDPNAFIFH